MTDTPDISLPGAHEATNGHPRRPGTQAAAAPGPVSAQPASPPEPEPPEPVEPAAATDAALRKRVTAPKEESAAPAKADPPTPPAKPDLPVVSARLDLPTALVKPDPQTVPPRPAPLAIPAQPNPPPAVSPPEPPVSAALPANTVGRAEPSRRQYLSAAQIRRLAVLAVTLVLLGTGAGLLGTLVLPVSYAARAEILYPIRQDEAGGFVRDGRNLTTQLVLLQGRAVLGPVAQRQGRAVDDLEDDVTVEVVETSEVIRIEARGPSREVAMGTLQAIVDRYFALESPARPSGVREYLDGELAAVQSGIADVQGRLTQLQSEAAAGIGDSAAVTAADNQLQTLLSREQDVQTQLDDLNIASAAGPNAQLLTPAYPVPDPVSPRPLFAGGAGALIGLIVAAGAVALAARRWIRN